MFKTKNNYVSISLAQKIFFFLVSIILLISSISYISNTYVYKQNIIQQSEEYHKNIIDQVIVNIDSYYKLLDNMAYSIMFNSTTQKALNQGIKTVAENYRARESVLETIRLFDFSRDEITFSIFSINDFNKWYTNKSTLDPYDFRQDIFYQTLTESDRKKVLVLDNPQNYIAQGQRSTVHSFVYTITDIYTLEPIGYLVIDVDRSYFKEFYDAWPSYADAVCIYNDKGDIVYHMPETEDVKPIWNDIKDQTKGSGKFHDYDYIFRTSSVTNWKLVHIINNQKLTSQINKANYFFLLAYIGLFIVLAVLSYALSRKITNPLRELTIKMRQVRDVQFQKRITNHSNDEIGILTRTYNSMLQRIQYLVNRAQTNEYIQKETELKVLQNQINPHFLYNTLEMICGMAACNENENIITVSQQLADMFRYNLQPDEYVTVREEIEQIKNYVSIMKFKLSTSFEVNYNIDEKLYNQKILRFIMQPFVENAIGHGFSTSEDDCHLYIEVSQRENNICFIIKDNGVGIPSAHLKTLKRYLEHQKNTHEHYTTSDNKYIGIGNVHHRLLLAYQANYEFIFESEQNVGTTITLILPPK
ncbi:MAG: cache domain-containing sensor histidine kinase [bacterium]